MNRGMYLWKRIPTVVWYVGKETDFSRKLVKKLSLLFKIMTYSVKTSEPITDNKNFNYLFKVNIFISVSRAYSTAQISLRLPIRGLCTHLVWFNLSSLTMVNLWLNLPSASNKPFIGKLLPSRSIQRLNSSPRNRKWWKRWDIKEEIEETIKTLKVKIEYFKILSSFATMPVTLWEETSASLIMPYNLHFTWMSFYTRSL